MRKELKEWTVKDLNREYNRINFPEYQREPNVWSRDAKQRLIDSMVREFDIASIYVYADSNGDLDCVDGRQRVGAIMSFLGQNPNDQDNCFKYRILNEVYEDSEHPFTELENLSYKDIVAKVDTNNVANKFIEQFQNYRLTVIQLSKSLEVSEFNLQFTRLNLGTTINSGEKLHAMVGELRDVCFNDIGEHLFLKDTNVPTRRFSREQLAAQIVAQVYSIESTKRMGREEFTRTRHFDLQRLFKQHTTISTDFKEWIEKTKVVMDLLQPAFSIRSSLRNRAIVVSTVLLAYCEKVTGAEDAELIATYIDEFVRCLKWQIGKAYDIDEEYRYLINFQRHVTQASVEKPAVEGRAHVLAEGLKLWKKTKRLRGDIVYLKRNPGVNLNLVR